MKRKTERTENEPLRVAFYTRVSTAEQVDEGESLDVQLANLRGWGKMKGWSPAGEYIDEGHSGTTVKRPHFQRLLRDAAQGLFDAVAVVKLDRFMRNAGLFYQTIETLQGHGVAFIAMQEGIDTTSKGTGTGQLFLNILACFAEFESARIGERVSDVRQSMAKDGRWSAGRPCYGYKWNRDARAFEVVESEAEVISRIFDLYVNKNMAMQPIAVLLNEEGYRMRPRSDRKQSEPYWSVNGVFTVLDNIAYTGEKNGYTYPPLIDRETFEAAQKRRGNARRVLRNPGNDALQGRVYCGLCGYRLTPHTNHTGKRYLRCFGRRQIMHLDGSPRCDLAGIRYEDMEHSVIETLWDVSRDSQILKEAVRAAVEQLEARRQSLGECGIDDQLARLKGKRDRLWDLYSNFGMPRETLLEKISKVDAEEQSLLARLSNVEPSARGEITELRRMIKAINELLDSGQMSALTLFEVSNLQEIVKGQSSVENPGRAINIERVRRLLTALDIKCVVYRDKIEIQGLLPTQTLGRSGCRVSGSDCRIL